MLKTFEFLAEKTFIYLSTELPKELAFRKIEFLKKYISGGVFAGGSYIVDYNSEFKCVEEITDVENLLESKILEHRKTKCYKESHKIYRIIISKEFTCEIKNTKEIYVINHSGGKLSIVKTGVNKGIGMEKLCNYLGIDMKEVMSVGNDINDINDIPMFEKSGFTISVIGSKSEVVKNIKYNINVTHIPFII